MIMHTGMQVPPINTIDYDHDVELASEFASQVRFIIIEFLDVVEFN